jgi:hypothetical protein
MLQQVVVRLRMMRTGLAKGTHMSSASDIQPPEVSGPHEAPVFDEDAPERPVAAATEQLPTLLAFPVAEGPVRIPERQTDLPDPSGIHSLVSQVQERVRTENAGKQRSLRVRPELPKLPRLSRPSASDVVSALPTARTTIRRARLIVNAVALLIAVVVVVVVATGMLK